MGHPPWYGYDVRITPACAGNSYARFCARIAGWDHPRVCGEQSRLEHISEWGIGSPPRVRGTAAESAKLLNDRGITPACAGNSSPCGSGLLLPQDHPRVCGEQLLALRALRNAKGSPPRVRGTGNIDCRLNQKRGITPACAGNRFLLVSHATQARITPACAGNSLVAP